MRLIFEGNNREVGSKDYVIAACGADNTTGTSGPGCVTGFTSLGYDLVDDHAGCAASGQAATNIVGQDARLAPLDFYGADTLLHARWGDSHTVDAGTCVLAADQRSQSDPMDRDLDDLPARDSGTYGLALFKYYFPLVGR